MAKVNPAAIASGAISLVGETMNNLRNNQDARTATAAKISSTNYDQLSAEHAAHIPLNFGFEHPFYEGLKGSLQSGMSGTSAGMSAGGPWGALIGAIAGTAAGGFSGTFGALKRNKQGREAEARLNPLSQSRFEGAVEGMRAQDISNSLINYAALGGQLNTQGGNFSQGLEIFNTGGRHEANSFGGIPQGVDSQGIPNTVEEGETKFNNYIFSNREMIDKNMNQGIGLPGRINGRSFADASKIINKYREERPNDAIANRTANTQLNTLRQLQEETKQLKEQVTMGMNQAAYGGDLNDLKATSISKILSNRGKRHQYATGDPLDLGMNLNTNAPFDEYTAMEQGIITNLNNIPDLNSLIDNAYVTESGNHANAINWINSNDFNNSNNSQEAQPTKFKFDPNSISNLGVMGSNLIQLIGALKAKPDVMSLPRAKAGTRLNENFKYNPLDREYLANKLRAESGATRRGVLNTSGGNRATATAGIIGVDKNYLNAIGDSYLKADESNQSKLMQMSQLINQARQANNATGLQEANLNSQIALNEYDYNARARAARANAIREGLASLSQNATDLGNYYGNQKSVNNMFPNYQLYGEFKNK